MIKKLRVKFVCINMAIVTAMLAIIFSLVIFFTGMGMELQGKQTIQQLANTVVHPEHPGVKRADLRRPYFVVRLGTDGSVLTYDFGYFEELEQEVLEEYVLLALAQEKDSGLLREQQLLYQLEAAPFGRTMIFADISGEMTTMRNLVKISLMIGVASFAVFFVVSVLLAGWAVKPVEQAWKQQKQFVADASHELKTPLTVIMTNAELLQSPDYPQEEQQVFISSILTMSCQMRGLVERLLELARVDNGTAKTAFSRLDFSELVCHGILPFEPVYFEKTLELSSEVEEDLWVKGSPSHLRQVMDILLDNASKYTPSGGTVTVRLRRQGRECLLTVANPGEPISSEDLKNIFKRFYRIDKARTMCSSYGLGLSIAETIVTEHGGKIWAESAEGVNTFLVSLPLA